MVTQPSAHSGDVYSIPVRIISDIALDNHFEFPTFEQSKTKHQRRFLKYVATVSEYNNMFPC